MLIWIYLLYVDLSCTRRIYMVLLERIFTILIHHIIGRYSTSEFEIGIHELRTHVAWNSYTPSPPCLLSAPGHMPDSILAVHSIAWVEI